MNTNNDTLLSLYYLCHHTTVRHTFIKETESLQENLEDKAKPPSFMSQDKLKEKEFNNFVENATLVY